MLMACASPIECNTIQEIMSHVWYLDSSYINHMIGNLNSFPSSANSVEIDVTLGNNVQIIVLGKGTISILTK